jgi:hypothetical protein
MILEKEFIDRVRSIPKIIPSKSGKAFYTGFRIEGDILYFYRVVPKTNWNLNLKELYCIYRAHNFINTSVIKKENGGRVNSPSVAVLMAINCIRFNGNRI